MPIEQSAENGKTMYTLSDGEVAVDIRIVEDESAEMVLSSDDVHLVELAEERAEGWSPSKDEFVDAVEDGLNLILDGIVVVDAAAYEASFELPEGSIVIAGGRWGGPEELFPG